MKRFLVKSGIFLVLSAVLPFSGELPVFGQNKTESKTSKTEKSAAFQPIDKRIFNAAGRGDDKAINKLLREGVSVNQKDEYGQTPLHIAVSNKKRSVNAVIALLKAGADINAPTVSGATPLLYSMYWAGAEEYTLVLLEYGADVNIARNNGETPLHIAAGWTNTDIFKLLLEKGANPNALNNERESPFMKTVRNYIDVDLIRLCIEKGANVHLTNKEGKSVLMLAEEALSNARTEMGKRRLLEIIEELKKAGAL